MEHKTVILPGTPNDDNRDYLPEAIKRSDMVVNENGNNSQPYPEKLIEYTDTVIDGVSDTWCEYVPASYDPSKKTPLVFSMHGGMMTGWGQAIYTSWTMVADREGFIVVFPNAHQRRFWLIEVDKDKIEEATTPREDGIYLNRPPEKVDDNHDIRLVLALLERMKEKYTIDTGRVFMQGMSMGNVMTAQFARHFGNVLAGAAGSGGPSSLTLLFDEDDKVINRGGPLAIWQTRLERDGVPPHYGKSTREVVARNRDYWRIVNGSTALPEIKIVGEDNLAFFKGEHGDVVFRDVKNRDHGQTLDDAELVWDYLFSGTRRNEDGSIEYTKPLAAREGDPFSIAIADGCDKAWVNNRVADIGSPVFAWRKLKYHGQNGNALIRGEYLCAPLSFIARLFDAKLEASEDTFSAVMTLKDGRTLQFARGSIGCVVDGRIQSMLCEAVHANGGLNISLEWLCLSVLGLWASTCENVLYVTDHFSRISLNMAQLIEDILTGKYPNA